MSSDVAEEIGKEQGGYYDISRWSPTIGRSWLAVPWCAARRRLIAYRKSWFDEIGVNRVSRTPGRAIAPPARSSRRRAARSGRRSGHTYSDAPAFTYPYLWSWGGKEVEADGKTVALNSKETLESVKFMAGFWKDAHDEGGLAWDDTNNNRAFLSGTICATNNAASIYIEAMRKPDTYLTEKGEPMWKDILQRPIPKGPGGQFSLPSRSPT